MDYFSRAEPTSALLGTALTTINQSLDSFYKDTSLEDRKIRLHSSTLGADELSSFIRAYLEGNITVGAYTESYQKLASDLFNSRYCISSNSGSSANLLAISSLIHSGLLNPGDRVLVPALAWSTSVFPLVQYGLIPVYLDIDYFDFNISLDSLKLATEAYAPKALLLIHTYGNPADLDNITSFCNSNQLHLIEDTCESMGATWDGLPVGSFGILGTFSSYYSHHICTLEGGLTITNDKTLADFMTSIRSHGWTRGIDFDPTSISGLDRFDPTFLFLNIGYNLRLSDPQAAMGIEQLNKLSDFVRSRQAAAARYIHNINHSSTLSKFIKYPRQHAKASSSWFGFPILCSALSKQDIISLRDYLHVNHIESRPFLAGNFSMQPVNSRYEYLQSPGISNIDNFHYSSFALPCHQAITAKNVDYICDHLKSFLSKF